MLVNKFPYIKLIRETINGKRLYLCPDGSRVSSVTTILAATKSEDSKQALSNWRKRVGLAKATEITVESSGRGTRMHTFLENYIRDGNLGAPGSNLYSIQAHKMASKIIEKELSKVTTFYGSEVSLLYPGLYAGATDLVAEYEGEIIIGDYKQSNRKKKEEWVEDYRNQLVAYILAHNKMYGTTINRGIIMMCTPDLEFQKFEVTKDMFEHYSQEWWRRVSEYYNV